MNARQSDHAPIWCSAGAFLLLLTLLRAGGLRLGDPSAKLTVAAGLCLLALLGQLLLPRREDGFHRPALFFPVAAALFFRIFLLDHETYDYLDFLSHWAAYFREHGGLAAIGDPVGNYNVPYLYFLALISYLDLPDLYLIKLFSVLFDVLLAWAGARLARCVTPKESLKPTVVFCLLLFLPTVVLNGAYWAQCDAIYAALCLHALACALERKGPASVLLLSLAFAFKLQAIFLVPLWCVLWYRGNLKFRQFFLFPAGFLAAVLPAMLSGRSLVDILNIYLDQTGTYPALTLNAPSVFSLIPYGVQVNEALFAKLGILAAFVLVFQLLGGFFPRRKAISDEMLVLLAAVMALGVPYFLPHMHERYYMLAEVLTLLLAVLAPRRYLLPALLVQTASLGGYHAYLRLQYAFPMAWGGVMNLAALLLLLFHLRFPPQTGRRVLSRAPTGKRTT